MAGGKETPRQKMIGMMYLVLTALLALNVSKEIINAFVTQDNQLLSTNNNLVRSVNGILNKFKIMELDLSTKERYAIWKPKVNKVVTLSNSLDDYLIQHKNIMLQESEGKSNWFTKDVTSQITEWVDFENIQNKEDYDIATRLFGGEKSSEGYKKGKEIKDKLLSLRDSLIMVMGSFRDKGKDYIIKHDNLKSIEELTKILENQQHPEKEKLLSIYSTLDQPEKLKNHGEDQDWQLVKFDHQPIVGAIGVFTELRNQVRIAEQKALEIIFSKLEGQIMPINKIEPQVIADRRYINVGDTIGVKVGIVAYDSTATYPIKYILNGEEKTSNNNQFTVKGSSAGTQTISGTLALEMADGKKELPWSFDYSVGKPQGAISLPEYDVIYGNGYENIIEGTASGFNPSDVRVTCEGCKSFSKKGGQYVAKANTGKTVKVRVSAPGMNYVKNYKVLALPKPILMFRGSDGRPLSVSEIKSGNKLSLQSPESSPLKIKYEVVSYNVDVSGISASLRRNNGAILSSQAKNAKNGIRKGNKLEFSQVKYRIKGNPKVLLAKGALVIKAK